MSMSTTLNPQAAYISLSDFITTLERQMFAQFSLGQRIGATPCALGAPGLGKTAVICATARRVAKRMGKSLLIQVVTVVDREVPDLRGMALPVKDDSDDGDGGYSLIYTRSAVLPDTEDENAHDLVLLLLDEVPAATLDHIKSLNSIILDYQAGKTTLDPAKYFVACTGNGTEHRSGASRLPAHGVNRLALYNVVPDTLLWLRDYAPDPANGISPIAARFVEERGGLFTDGGVPDTANTPFATLRSFTKGVQALFYYFAADPARVNPSDPAEFASILSDKNRGLATTLLAGYVGAGVAREFIGYASVYGVLTRLDAILADPEGAPVPKEQSALYAQALFVVNWTRNEATTEAKRDNAKLLTYVSRLRGDLVAPTIVKMQRKAPGVKQLPNYATVAMKHIDLIEATMAA
jgi:hypothetical protein